MASKLTADQILAQFENLIQDSLDQTTELFLLNEVKDSIESERMWKMLMGMKSPPDTATASTTFQTTFTLPLDFGHTSPRGIYVGTDLIPYKEIPYESQIDFQAVTYAYFVDLYNNTYSLCGTISQSGAIKFFYRRVSATMNLTADGGLPWIFPARFHPLLVYEMAIKYFAIDQGDKGRAWDDRWAQYAERIREQMYQWDDQLQTPAIQNEFNTFTDPGSYPNIIDMDSGPGGGSVMFG